MMILLTILAVLAIGAFTMSTAPGNTGARLWDEAVQGVGPKQPGQPPMIPGGPEGVIYANAGTIVCDETGALWRKGTDRSLATGWCEVFDTCNIAELVQEQGPG